MGYTILHNFSNSTTGLTAATESTGENLRIDEDKGCDLQFRVTVTGTADAGAAVKVYRRFDPESGMGTSWDTIPYATFGISTTGGTYQITVRLSSALYRTAQAVTPGAQAASLGSLCGGGGVYRFKVTNSASNSSLYAYRLIAKTFQL